MKDLYTSRKTGWTLRRIELRNLQCYLVRPSFLMPYLVGSTEDVQAPLVWFFRDFSCHSMEVDRGGRPSPLRSTKAVEKRGPPPDPPSGLNPEQSHGLTGRIARTGPPRNSSAPYTLRRRLQHEYPTPLRRHRCLQGLSRLGH